MYWSSLSNIGHETGQVAMIENWVLNKNNFRNLAEQKSDMGFGQVNIGCEI